MTEELNSFFSRFEHNDTEILYKSLKRVNPHKAAGPEGIPSCDLRACADQLAGVFTDIFNQSLSQSVVPTCFKMATIVPVPKKAKVTELNDYHPVSTHFCLMP